MSTIALAPTADTTKEAAPTSYVVLALETAPGEGTKGWREVARVNATSADQAIRKAEKHGVLVAVAARSWKPRKVTTETKTVLKLEDA